MPTSSSSYSVGYLVEKFGPLIAVLPWIITAYFSKNWFVEKISADEISASGLFSAVFGWASIQTGFIFSVFGFVATKSGGFIEEFRSTQYIDIFQTYVKRAMYIGLFLTIYSIPIMRYRINIRSDFQYWIIVIWFGVFIWAFGAFLRVALNFGKLLSKKDDTYFPG